MSLQPADRAAFIELLEDLGPDGDGRRAVAFIEARKVAALAELSERPGMDQVRAGVLRALEHLDVESAPLQQAALGAIEAYAEDVAQPDPAVLLERAPAWVGIAYLEALGTDGWSSEAATQAAALARVGFAAARLEGIGDGEVLWALAESAGEVGWADRERFLLDEARAASFADEERAGEVALIYALRCLDDGDPAGIELLEQISSLEAASARTRVHARAVRGAIAQQSNEDAVALRWFKAARDEVDAEAEPDVAARLDALLEEIS